MQILKKMAQTDLVFSLNATRQRAWSYSNSDGASETGYIDSWPGRAGAQTRQAFFLAGDMTRSDKVPVAALHRDRISPRGSLRAGDATACPPHSSRSEIIGYAPPPSSGFQATFSRRGEGFDRAWVRRLGFRPARSGASQRLVRAGDGIQGLVSQRQSILLPYGRRWPGGRMRIRRQFTALAARSTEPATVIRAGPLTPAPLRAGRGEYPPAGWRWPAPRRQRPAPRRERK